MDDWALPGLGSGPVAAASAVSMQSASAQVAGILRSEIQRGDYPPETRLRQRDVSARLGVSTTPVREAFQVLQTEGFLQVENHRGARVVGPTVADVEEGYAIRSALESLAIRHAASHFTPASAESLRELLVQMQSSSSQQSWAELDHEFHRRLNAMAAMPRLAALIERLRGGVAYYVESAFSDPDRRAAADLDHVHLLEACLAGEPDRAESVIRAHLDAAAQAVIASINHQERAVG